MFPFKKFHFALCLLFSTTLSVSCARKVAPDQSDDPVTIKRKELLATPGNLLIETQAVTPIKNGRTLPLQAFIVEKSQTRNGITIPENRRDVTEDVQWSVQPALAWIAGQGRLDYECISQDVHVHADLLGQRNANLVLPFQKKIKTLSVEVSESSQVIERSEYIQLKVVAYCEDGTQSDVTCQAEWKLPSDLGHMGRCGNLRITNQDVRRLGEFTISAKYAEIRASRRLHFKTLDRL